MSAKPVRVQRWNTSCFGTPADTSPAELAALGKHLDCCTGQRGRMFALKCSVETLNNFAAPRTVTILALFAVLSLCAALLL